MSDAPREIWWNPEGHWSSFDDSEIRCSPSVKYVRADLPPKVKPLVWHGPDVGDEYSASGGGVVYVIRTQTEKGYWVSGVRGYFSTIEAAQAAAQADYEARILAALVQA